MASRRGGIRRHNHHWPPAIGRGLRRDRLRHGSLAGQLESECDRVGADLRSLSALGVALLDVDERMNYE